jgi:hypothetical protein
MKRIKAMLMASLLVLVFSVGIFAENEPGHTHTGKTCLPDCPMYGQLTAPPEPDENSDDESIFDRIIFEIGKIFI